MDKRSKNKVINLKNALVFWEANTWTVVPVKKEKGEIPDGEYFVDKIQRHILFTAGALAAQGRSS